MHLKNYTILVSIVLFIILTQMAVWEYFQSQPSFMPNPQNPDTYEAYRICRSLHTSALLSVTSVFSASLFSPFSSRKQQCKPTTRCPTATLFSINPWKRQKNMIKDTYCAKKTAVPTPHAHAHSHLRMDLSHAY